MRRLLLPIVLLCGIVTLAGCPPVDKGSDATLVYIDRTRTSAFDTLDQFVTWEKAQTPAFKTAHADIHAFAEEVRKNAPTMFHDIEAAEDAYKAVKTPANGDRLAAVTKAITDMVNLAAKYLLTK